MQQHLLDIYSGRCFFIATCNIPVARGKISLFEDCVNNKLGSSVDSFVLLLFEMDLV